MALNNLVVVAINNSAKHLDSLRKLQEMQAEASASSTMSGETSAAGPDTRLRRISRDARASVVRRFSSSPPVTMPTASESLPASPRPDATVLRVPSLPAAGSPSAVETEDSTIQLDLSMECPEVVLIADARTDHSKAILLGGYISTKYLQTNEKMMVAMETKDLALRHLRYKDIIEGNVQYGREIFKPCSVYGEIRRVCEAIKN